MPGGPMPGEGGGGALVGALPSAEGPPIGGGGPMPMGGGPPMPPMGGGPPIGGGGPIPMGGGPPMPPMGGGGPMPMGGGPPMGGGGGPPIGGGGGPPIGGGGGGPPIGGGGGPPIGGGGGPTHRRRRRPTHRRRRRPTHRRRRRPTHRRRRRPAHRRRRPEARGRRRPTRARPHARHRRALPGRQRGLRAVAALPRVLLHRLVDEVVDRALQLARHLLEGLPENLAALERTWALLVRIGAHGVLRESERTKNRRLEALGAHVEALDGASFEPRRARLPGDRRGPDRDDRRRLDRWRAVAEAIVRARGRGMSEPLASYSPTHARRQDRGGSARLRCAAARRVLVVLGIASAGVLKAPPRLSARPWGALSARLSAPPSAPPSARLSCRAAAPWRGASPRARRSA
jgi:hypothetical protein